MVCTKLCKNRARAHQSASTTPSIALVTTDYSVFLSRAILCSSDNDLLFLISRVDDLLVNEACTLCVCLCGGEGICVFVSCDCVQGLWSVWCMYVCMYLLCVCVVFESMFVSVFV